ncbi:hypothetical protein [Synechocystis sp. PCC 7509]|uniref:hypothetical protein n=1 Tax=Synechocystis sp. PCC 7509 TaxID=927677 RepID=UPI0002ACEB4E|nr:hypothetical protein [Synechocystis sp. PCC 7509]
MIKDRTVPGILLLRWIEELNRCADLMEVLHRSVKWTELEHGGEEKTRIAMGDDELVRIIRDRLTDLFGEVQEVNDGTLFDKC